MPKKTTKPPKLTSGRKMCEGFEKTIAERMRKFRLEKKLTQQQVADSMGIRRSQYEKYEYGQSKVSVVALHRYCKAVGIDDHSRLYR